MLAPNYVEEVEENIVEKNEVVPGDSPAPAVEEPQLTAESTSTKSTFAADPREVRSLRRAAKARKRKRRAQRAETQVLRRSAGLGYRVASWLAVRLAPFYNALYDLQMQIGQGVRKVEHRVQLPHFPTGAPPLRAVFLSDLHYGPTSGRTALRQAWNIAREAKPDILLLGGDYLFADERGLPALLMELQRWQSSPPPGGIYACLGNHDYYAGRETIETTLRACGVQVLVNDAVPLPTPWKGIWIAGVDDEWCGEPNLAAAFHNVSPDASTLLLAHNPDICEQSLLRRAAITLCGHTHGGQICLPNGDGLYLPAKHGKEYSAGLFRHAGQWLFVSRGVGTVGLPLRMFCPPEVVVFEFTGRSSQRGTSPRTRVVPIRTP
jgi:predicted MPP superfamily phosphohydrolase